MWMFFLACLTTKLLFLILNCKQLNTEEAWGAYQKLRNQVSKMLETAHEKYRSQILDTSFSGHKCQFWNI